VAQAVPPAHILPTRRPAERLEPRSISRAL